jgi:hypothetical protein
MKRITQQEAQQYRELNPQISFKYSMREVVAYTLTPDTNNPGWDEITYYGAS